MPDSFTLPNVPATNAVPTGLTSQPELQLSDVVHQQQGAIVFEGSRIPRLAGVPDAFLIFYLNEEDERNGFGTVIQLDPSTKQAAIFADLNPEYTYLFYNDEQGRLQTLLWCIEFATRTPDGLYVTQAKVHGKGVTTEDIHRLSQIQLPAQPSTPEHQLVEADPLPQPTRLTASSLPTTPQLQPEISAPASTPPPLSNVAALPQVNPLQSEPETSELQLPPLPTPAAKTPVNVTPVNQTTISPTPTVQASTQSDILPPLPNPAPAASNSAPLLDPKPDWNQPRPAYVDNLSSPTQAANVPGIEPTTQPIQPPDQTDWAAQDPGSVAVESLDLNFQQPAGQLAPTQNTEPAISTNPVKPLLPTAPAPSATAKQPVGRPPKPLTSDQSWMIEPQDFTWLKQISREPLEPHKEELRQKIIKQIRKNRPNLIDDWQFHGAFEQAFQALAQTYDLVPTLRHDLLKSLLNGKVVDQVVVQQQSQI